LLLLAAPDELWLLSAPPCALLPLKQSASRRRLACALRNPLAGKEVGLIGLRAPPSLLESKGGGLAVALPLRGHLWAQTPLPVHGESQSGTAPRLEAATLAAGWCQRGKHQGARATRRRFGAAGSSQRRGSGKEL